MMNKRGSLELSIQAIVIIVIAFVILGLGLGFVRSQFKSITETSSSVQEQVRQQVLEDLRTGDKKLSFPATTLTVEKGGSQDIAIGVKNTRNGNLKFIISIKTLRQQEDSAALEPYLDEQVKYFYLQGPFTLKTTDAEVYNIKILGEGNKGSYLVSLKVLEVVDPATADPTITTEYTVDNTPVTTLSDSYAEKSFFVNII